MAMVETIPVLFMMVLIFNFSLGFFGAIHSGILNSIGSYNYAMETFRFRSNLMYFRPAGLDNANYSNVNNRVHGTTKEGSEYNAVTADEKSRWPAAVRGITFNFVPTDSKRNLQAALDASGGETTDRTYGGKDSASNIWFANSTYVPQEGPGAIQTSRVWIKTVYGICVTADCGE